MDRAYVASGFVRHGALKLRQKQAFAQACATWPDGEVLVTIAPARATRSRALNARYWSGYVAPLAAHTHYDPRVLHAYLKKRFLPAAGRVLLHDQAGVVVDECVLDAPTTTTLTTEEFSAYLDRIAVFARRLGVPIGSELQETVA
jgi:hypothetical protein